MIGKVVRPRKDGKSSFRSITRYIAGVGHKDKCTYLGTRNLNTVDFPGLERPSDFIELAAVEMRSTAYQNTRSEKPILHVVMSWPKNEKPNVGQIDQAIEMLEKNYGLEGCQCIYGLHENTRHTHLHVAFNRIHPETYKAIQAAGNWTKKELERTIREIELQQGWTQELTGKHYTISGSMVVKSTKKQVREAPISDKARTFEALTGEKSAQSALLEKITPELLKNITNWKGFHEKLHALGVGVEYKQKGSGAVFVVGDIQVKASQVSREVSLKKLENRFGGFEPCGEVYSLPVPQEKGTELTLYEIYNAGKLEFQTEKAKVLDALKEKHEKERSELSNIQQERRSAIFDTEDWKGRGEERNLVKSLIAVEHSRQKKELFSEQAEERKQALKKIGHFPRFKQWEEQQRERSIAMDDIGHVTPPEGFEEAMALDVYEQMINEEFERQHPGYVGEVTPLSNSKKISQQEVKELNLLNGDNVKIWTTPKENADYKGKILSVDKDRGFCVQQIGKTSLLVHQLDDLDNLPQKGEDFRISYKGNEKAEAMLQSERSGVGYEIPEKMRPYVIDHGWKIETTKLTEEAVLVTLQLAQSKWGNCKVDGCEAYIKLCVKIAAENGFKISNPELQEQIKEQQKQLQYEDSEPLLGFGEQVGAFNLGTESKERKLQDSVSLEQEIKNMKLLEGNNVKIYTEPSKLGSSQGEVLHVDKDKGICVQQVGKNALVAHQLDKLERIPEKGENLRVVYKGNEKAKIATREQANERNRGR